MAARLRVLQPGNPECASEREEKENETAEERVEEGRKKTRKEKNGGEKSPLVSLFLFRDARLFTFHLVRIRVYSSRIYLYSSMCRHVCVCI